MACWSARPFIGAPTAHSRACSAGPGVGVELALAVAVAVGLGVAVGVAVAIGVEVLVAGGVGVSVGVVLALADPRPSSPSRSGALRRPLASRSRTLSSLPAGLAICLEATNDSQPPSRKSSYAETIRSV